jgi:hypothetical protein
LAIDLLAVDVEDLVLVASLGTGSAIGKSLGQSRQPQIVRFQDV